MITFPVQTAINLVIPYFCLTNPHRLGSPHISPQVLGALTSTTLGAKSNLPPSFREANIPSLWSPKPTISIHFQQEKPPLPPGPFLGVRLALWNRFNITGSAGRNWFRAIFQEQFLGQIGYRVGTRSSWLRQWQITFYGNC